MAQFEELRERFPSFIYHAYHVQMSDGACRITYDFEIPGLSEFHPTWTFPVRRPPDADAQAVLNELVFQLGMAETISYYKITCPRTVVVECGTLTRAQQQWWRSLYYNGLGEFMYVNGIAVSEEELVRFECRTPEEAGVVKPLRDDAHYEGFLVPVGGGKDSVVTLETLRGQDIMTYHINDDSAIDEVIEVFHGNTRIRRRTRAAQWADGSRESSAAAMERMNDGMTADMRPGSAAYEQTGARNAAEPKGPSSGAEEPAVSSAVGGPFDCQAKRTLDKNMLELNRQGYLNGHTPFSAIVAFSSVTAAFLNGRSQIALSNESSANESTVRDSTVNHQYSKSYEFEEDFQNYLGQIVTSNIHYYSFLRPLTEIQIAGLFAKSRAYHPVFLSCNRGSRKGVWCGNCPKCLFVYIILSPFLPQEELDEIFGGKLLDRDSLEKEFRELAGLDENKPFECVGTRGEVAAALKDYVRRGGHSLLTDRYQEEILAFPDELSDYLGQWNEHHVPEEYAQLLRERVKELNGLSGSSGQTGRVSNASEIKK